MSTTNGTLTHSHTWPKQKPSRSASKPLAKKQTSRNPKPQKLGRLTHERSRAGNKDTAIPQASTSSASSKSSRKRGFDQPRKSSRERAAITIQPETGLREYIGICEFSVEEYYRKCVMDEVTHNDILQALANQLAVNSGEPECPWNQWHNRCIHRAMALLGGKAVVA